YSPGGHLNSMTVTDTFGTATQSFGLDHLYRLTSATGSYGSPTYTYDTLGNLTSKEGVTFTFGSGRPHQVTATSSGLALLYDRTGNVTSILNSQSLGKYLYYDTDGRVKDIQDTLNNKRSQYKYDPMGNRARRVDTQGGPDTITYFVSDLYEKTGATFKKFIYLDGKRVGEWRSDNTHHYYLNDHLGGLNLVTDASAAVEQRVEYKPYGETSRVETPGFPMSFTYAGVRNEQVTGLYDYGARFYDTALGRFLAVDPILSNPLNLMDLNPYGYAQGNPIGNVDVGGLSVAPALAGIVVGVGVSIVTQGCLSCGLAARAAIAGAAGGAA